MKPDSSRIPDRLLAEHTPAAIQSRLAEATRHSYVGDFVLGAIDGAVTTFAVVAGVAGAQLSSSVAIVLGMANLVADGFSMAVSNYLRARSDRQFVEHCRRLEEDHIDAIPDGEREEIRQIFAAKGFDGVVLDEIVDVITRDRRRWVDTMVTEELGLRLENPHPVTAGWSTFIAFVFAGFIPLAPFLLGNWLPRGKIFLVSSIATAATFFLIGLAKGVVLRRSLFWSGIETLLTGGAAAALAYLVGRLFQHYGAG